MLTQQKLIVIVEKVRRSTPSKENMRCKTDAEKHDDKVFLIALQTLHHDEKVYKKKGDHRIFESPVVRVVCHFSLPPKVGFLSCFMQARSFPFLPNATSNKIVHTDAHTLMPNRNPRYRRQGHIQSWSKPWM